MSETIILAIIVCSCFIVITLLIAIGILIYNYQDNHYCLEKSIRESDLEELSEKFDCLEARFDYHVKEHKDDKSQKD